MYCPALLKPVVLALCCLFGWQGFSQPLPQYKITVCTPQSKGYYFFAAVKPFQKPATYEPLHVILDSAGTVVYYKRFPARRRPGDFKLQPNGLMSFYNRDKFFLMDSTFTIVDSVGIKNGVQEDEHELQILPNGHYVLMGLEDTIMDLRRYHYFNKRQAPGSAKTVVKASVVQELDKNKHLVFEWHSKLHFNFDDEDPYFMADSANVDWTHFNAVECDKDGNFLISVRYLNEITKVRRSDGAVMWRLGGKRNQFRFLNDSLFVGQHDIRLAANSHITLFDNGRAGNWPHAATTKEYELDEKNRTIKLVWSYTDNANAHSLFSGNVQKLPNGHVLVSYGTSDQSAVLFNVVEPSGKKVFEMLFKDSASTYRAFNYQTLPWKLRRPAITSYEKNGKLYLDAGAMYGVLLWSNGQQNQRVIEITKAGVYTMMVPTGSGGFLVSAPVKVEMRNGKYKIVK